MFSTFPFCLSHPCLSLSASACNDAGSHPKLLGVSCVYVSWVDSGLIDPFTGYVTLGSRGRKWLVLIELNGDTEWKNWLFYPVF